MAKAVKLEVKEETVETYPDIDIPELLPDRMRGDSFDHSEELPQETPNPKENHDLMDEHDPDTSKENDIDDTLRVDGTEETPNHDQPDTEETEKEPAFPFDDPYVQQPEPTTPTSPEKPSATSAIQPEQLELPEDAHIEIGSGGGKGRGSKRTIHPQSAVEFAVASIPPPVLSEKAIDSRLRRIFKIRADGTMLVDESWKQQWDDKEGRIKVLEMFEKVGYNTDRAEKMGLGKWFAKENLRHLWVDMGNQHKPGALPIFFHVPFKKRYDHVEV